MQVCFKQFASAFQSWHALFSEAAAFATTIGKDKLISISHSCDHSTGVVTVWYWGQPWGS